MNKTGITKCVAVNNNTGTIMKHSIEKRPVPGSGGACQVIWQNKTQVLLTAATVCVPITTDLQYTGLSGIVLSHLHSDHMVTC